VDYQEEERRLLGRVAYFLRAEDCGDKRRGQDSRHKRMGEKRVLIGEEKKMQTKLQDAKEGGRGLSSTIS